MIEYTGNAARLPKWRLILLYGLAVWYARASAAQGIPAQEAARRFWGGRE